MIIKSFGWEVIAFFLAVLFYWVFFGNFINSLLAAVIFTFIKSIGLYFYLNLWKKTKWLK